MLEEKINVRRGSLRQEEETLYPSLFLCHPCMFSHSLTRFVHLICLGVFPCKA